jgi:hypothetical protein
MVTAVIGVFVTIVYFHGRDTRRKGGEKRDRAQAQYLAKGAHQHFLLKFKFLPTELYDAVSYAVGKNPYFDFAIDVSAVTGNTFQAQGGTPDFGPMFFTGGSGTQVTESGGKLVVNRSAETALYFNTAAGFQNDANSRYRMEYMLNHYTLDIATDYPAQGGAGIVVVSSDPHPDAARMGRADAAQGGRLTGWRDPFKGTYLVQSVRILGIGGASAGTAGKKYQSDTVLLTTEAIVRRDGQLSLVSRDASGNLKPLVVQREIKTALKQDQGWLELKEEVEDAASYRARTDTDATARRTEISTGVYYVTRQER